MVPKAAADFSSAPICPARSSRRQTMPASSSLRCSRPGGPSAGCRASRIPDAMWPTCRRFSALAPPAARRRARARHDHAVVVGDAASGRGVLQRRRLRHCHSRGRRPQGHRRRLPVAAIQGRLVMPRGSGGYPRGFNSPPDPAEAPKTVTITPASGDTIDRHPALDYGLQRHARRCGRRAPHHRAQRRRAEGRGDRSARVAHRSHEEADGQGHARSDRVSGDVEMRRPLSFTLLVVWRWRRAAWRRGRSIRRCCSSRRPTPGRRITATTPAGTSAR